METPAETKTASSKADKNNPLGISRGIYALGYSTRDALLWALATTAAMVAVITIGVKKDIGPIKKFADLLTEGHEWWKGKTKKWFGGGGVVTTAVIAGGIVGHIAQIPSGVTGWKKAQAAFDRHNVVTAEKDKLAGENTVLREENELLKTKLAAAAKDRPAFAESVRAQPAEAEVGRA